jgi:hypothetical protein
MIKVFEIILCMYSKIISHDEYRSIIVIYGKYRSVQYYYIYPAMTAFNDQYGQPNICFDIGQL